MLELKVPVRVADHTLLRLVDKGSYGEVWLACTTFGTFRAVKIIHRSGFTDSEPYERELRGIRSFEPISRSHPGFIPLLQIGQEEDYFYCVMEVGDDLRNGQAFSPESYTPKTLERFRDNRVLAPEECLKLSLQLVDAVARLHDANLVHRDIKPANILFVHGYPKLADIGLVTDPNSATSLVGTLGFVPPEGTGKPQADVYALGKVLYECLTGLDRTRAPQLPRLDPEATSPPLFMELMEVIRRAIHPDPACRYQTARALHGDLLVLANGASVLRLRALEGLWIRIKRFSKAAALVVAVLGTASYWHFKELSVREHEQQQRIGQQTASGMQDWDQLDYGAALGAFASALHGTEGHPAQRYRLSIHHDPGTDA
jgi:serine/threonine protein kinase